MLSAEAERDLAWIADEYLHIDNLKTRNLDSHDFHEVSVWELKEALYQAYLLGRESARKNK